MSLLVTGLGRMTIGWGCRGHRRRRPPVSGVAVGRLIYRRTAAASVRRGRGKPIVIGAADPSPWRLVAGRQAGLMTRLASGIGGPGLICGPALLMTRWLLLLLLVAVSGSLLV